MLFGAQPTIQRFFERATAPINVAINRFIADPVAGGTLGETSGDLFGRPACGEALQHFPTKFRLPFEFIGSTAGMSAQHQLLGALRIVATRPLLACLAVAHQFTADRRYAPLQNSGNETLTFTVRMQAVNLYPFREAQLPITSFFHRNTFVRCCILFVNLRGSVVFTV